MEKKILSSDLVDIIGEYGIVKTRERLFFDDGKPAGRIYSWYDVCLESGYGDIVTSCKKLKDARKWAKEN